MNRPPLTPYGEYVRNLEAGVRQLLHALDEEHSPSDSEPDCPICTTAALVRSLLEKRPFPTDKGASPLEDALQEMAVACQALESPRLSTGAALYWRRQKAHLERRIKELRITDDQEGTGRAADDRAQRSVQAGDNVPAKRDESPRRA